MKTIETEIKPTEIESESMKNKLQKEIKFLKHILMTTPHKELILKLGLKKFGWQILKWQEFLDTFDATVLKTTLPQPVEKFSFFKSRVGKQSFGINRMARTYKCKL